MGAGLLATRPGTARRLLEVAVLGASVADCPRLVGSAYLDLSGGVGAP